MKQFLIVIPIFLCILLGACSTNGIDSHVGTLVALTQTASIWSPTPVTPAATHVPDQVLIVNTLNSALSNPDPFEQAIDAQYSVADIAFDSINNAPFTNRMMIHVECTCIHRSSCTVERALVMLVRAFKKEGIRKKIAEQIPSTIEVIEVKGFDRSAPVGVVDVELENILAFYKDGKDGGITGEQLAARITLVSP